MFRKLFGAKSAIRKPDVIPDSPDLSFGLPVAIDAASLLGHRHFGELKQRYDGSSPEDRSMILDKCCLTNEWQQAIESWSLQEPEDFHSNLFHAVFFTFKAWEARTAARGSEVTIDGALSFEDYLAEAVQMLQHCDGLQNDPEVGARMIRIAMGLGEPEAAQEWFTAMEESYPGHIHGHMFLFNLLTPKWYGSLEAMGDLASQVREKLSAYPGLVLVLLMDMTERWYVLNEESGKKARAWIRDNLSGVDRLYQWSQEVVIHPSYRNHSLNYFAFLYHVADENSKRDSIISSLHPSIPLYPWGYLGIDSSKKFWKQW